MRAQMSRLPKQSTGPLVRRVLISVLLLAQVSAYARTSAPGSGQEGAKASAQTLLTSVKDVVALTNVEAARALPVKLEATVTYLQPEDASMFVQSEGVGTYVNFGRNKGLLPGDRVVVVGVTDASFRPEVTASDVQFLAHGPLPKPQPAKFADLIQSKLDSRYVVISGHVLAVSMDKGVLNPGMRLQLKVPEGVMGARVAHPGNLKMEELLDSDVRLTGVAGGQFDGRMQMAGVWLDMYYASGVQIEHRPAASPWDLPAMPMDQVIYAYRAGNGSSRVRIAGTLTYYEEATLAVVEQGGLGMVVETGSTLPLHVGSSVEATGFPEITEGNVRLVHGQVRQLDQSSRVEPRTINWEDASAGKYAYNLVAIEGNVVAVVHDAAVDLFVIYTDGHLFSATLRHNSSDASQAGGSMAIPTVGSKVRVTGICFIDEGDHWRERLWFDMRMRSLQDIAVLQEPGWWTVKRLAYITTALSVIILIAVIWAGWLDRRLRAQSAVLARQSQEDAIRERRLARQEQQRSHILELINSPESLPEVLAEIRAMVSSRLFGASCWFELSAIAGGSTDLVRPSSEGVVFQEMFAPDGTNLGLLLATPLPRSASDVEIAAALTAGARLAELAIDTRRLYSDLRHRSEYDLLTDIPNRFSMEKHLDHLMHGATRRDGDNLGMFGLIYVDLDKFKQINDRFGHRAGDLYLQAVTGRMKFQLRNGDVLARIGGDEFIALVPILRSRVDAEEIAMRLERCFDEPFEIEGFKLHGSASVGLAVYPEDGSTKEDLQRAADAFMYAHKEGKKQQEKVAEVMQRVWREDLPH